MGLLTLLFPIFLALVLIIVLFGIIYLIKRREGEIKEERIKSFMKKLKTIQDVDEIIDTETYETTMQDIIEEGFNYPCLIPPYSSGTCDPGYKIETSDSGKKCCYPKDAIKPSKLSRDLKYARQLIVEIFLSIVADGIIQRLWNMTQSASSRAAARTKAKTAKAIRAYRAAKIARATKMAQAAKAGAIAARTAMRGATAVAKFALGPLMILDIATLTLDILDTEGYATFISQDMFKQTKNNLDYEIWKAMEQSDLEYPMLYPLSEIYGEPFEVATELGYARIFEKYYKSDLELEENSEYKKAIDDYTDATIDYIMGDISEEPEFPTLISDYAMKIPEDHHLERDEYIYEEMKNLLPLDDLLVNTKMYPKISSRKTIGITLSEEGARYMNEKNKSEWLTNDESEKMTAVYTDKYSIYESGASGADSEMKEIPLAEKTTLAAPYGILFSMCEKRRQSRSEGGSITPTSFGAYWDFNNSKCIFTNELCNKYVMQWNPDKNDCELYEGQEVAEWIFGPTLTRDLISRGNEMDDVWTQRGDQLKSGDAEEIVDVLVNTLYNPFNLIPEEANWFNAENWTAGGSEAWYGSWG